ncbi:MAG: hemerythrin domain-containing protein [Candidatus Hydrogenedentes bacterium]|nr:hemerythrin domain-containing protein [Candidatus Hydrogenedentota bacterium]
MSGAGLAGRAFGQAVQPGQSAEKKPADGEEEVSAVEDLMREHGVLARLLLLYEHQLGSSSKGWEFSREAVAATANLLRRFVEDYHEKLEEQHVFTRFTQPGEMAELVKTLRQQHDAGRRVTDAILELASGDVPVNDANRAHIQDLIRQFARMYWPHQAREDTVLFPAFKEIVPKEEYEKLGDQFEKREHELFGEKGFEGIVEQVAELERLVGIYDLDQFTPRI